MTPPVRRDAAEEGQNRQGEARHLLGPQEGCSDDRPRNRIGEHRRDLADEGERDDRLHDAIEGTDEAAAREGRPTLHGVGEQLLRHALAGLRCRSYPRRRLHRLKAPSWWWRTCPGSCQSRAMSSPR